MELDETVKCLGVLHGCHLTTASGPVPLSANVRSFKTEESAE